MLEHIDIFLGCVPLICTYVPTLMYVYIYTYYITYRHAAFRDELMCIKNSCHSW